MALFALLLLVRLLLATLLRAFAPLASAFAQALHAWAFPRTLVDLRCLVAARMALFALLLLVHLLLATLLRAFARLASAFALALHAWAFPRPNHVDGVDVVLSLLAMAELLYPVQWQHDAPVTLVTVMWSGREDASSYIMTENAPRAWQTQSISGFINGGKSNVRRKKNVKKN